MKKIIVIIFSIILVVSIVLVTLYFYSQNHIMDKGGMIQDENNFANYNVNFENKDIH